MYTSQNQSCMHTYRVSDIYVLFFSLSSFRLSASVDMYKFLIYKYIQIAKALQFMHERGITHLDVKPDNIYGLRKHINTIFILNLEMRNQMLFVDKSHHIS